MAQHPVLVVDDDADLRRSLSTALAEGGYEVREASSGNAAIAVLSETTHSLVLLDLMMADGTGWDVLEKLRLLPEAANLPVVVISTYASSVPTGARALLRKPIGQEELLATVARFVPFSSATATPGAEARPRAEP